MNRESKLIKKIQKNKDRQAADLLVRIYYDEIYWYVYKQLHDKDKAMDLTQEIFIHCLQSINRYDKSKSSFRTWLYRLSTNKLIDFYRKNKPIIYSDEITEDFTREEFEDMSLKIHHKVTLNIIEAYVSKGDFTSQQIYRLKIHGQYSFKDIAEALNLSESTIKTKYYRLINKIREVFEDDYQ